MTYQEVITNLKKVISTNCININYNNSEYDELPLTKNFTYTCRNIENYGKYYNNIIKYTRTNESGISATFDCNNSNIFNNLITTETQKYLIGNNALTSNIENDCEFINRLYNFCLSSLCYIEYIPNNLLIDKDISILAGRPSSIDIKYTYKMGLCYKKINITSSEYNSLESNKNIKITDINSLLNSIVKNNKNLLLPCNIYYGAFIYNTNPR